MNFPLLFPLCYIFPLLFMNLNMGKDLKRKEFDKGIIQFILPRKKKEMELVARSTYGNVMDHEMAHLQK